MPEMVNGRIIGNGIFGKFTSDSREVEITGNFIVCDKTAGFSAYYDSGFMFYETGKTDVELSGNYLEVTI